MSQLPKANQSSLSNEVSAFDVSVLLDKCGEALKREVTNLLYETSRGKLSPASARDLVNYTKLLSDIKKQQLEELLDLTDEELAQLESKA